MRYPAGTLNAREGCEGSLYGSTRSCCLGSEHACARLPATPGFRPSLAARFAAALISPDKIRSFYRVFFSGGAVRAKAWSTPQARLAMASSTPRSAEKHRLAIITLLIPFGSYEQPFRLCLGNFHVLSLPPPSPGASGVGIAHYRSRGPFTPPSFLTFAPIYLWLSGCAAPVVSWSARSSSLPRPESSRSAIATFPGCGSGPGISCFATPPIALTRSPRFVAGMRFR